MVLGLQVPWGGGHNHLRRPFPFSFIASGLGILGGC